MAIQRITQSMMTGNSLDSMQLSLNKLSRLQEQITTGKLINRPSDSPSDTTSAMRYRESLARVDQHLRNAQDGNGWMSLTDSTLSSMTLTTNRANELAISAVSGAMSKSSRESIAAEVDQLRKSLIADANAQNLDRPIFGGITSGTKAYDDNGVFIGVSGQVNRTIAEGTRVQINVNGPDVFSGPNGSVFDQLAALSVALRADDTNAISTIQTQIQASAAKIVETRASLGATHRQVEAAMDSALDNQLRLKTSISDLENVDMPKTFVDLKMQEVAYQAALSSTAKVLQPSLMDFLR